jgi:hypothetical protein
MNIFKEQQEAVDKMAEDLKAHRWSLVKCGQRSGKGIMVWTLVKQSDYERIVWLSTLPEKDLRQSVRSMRIMMSIPDELEVVYWSQPERASKRTLVIIDEAMHMPDSYSVLEQELLKGCDVVVIGSRGPEYDLDIRWTKLKGHSYHAWELNPLVTRASLQPFYAEDSLRAARDYEGY